MLTALVFALGAIFASPQPAQPQDTEARIARVISSLTPPTVFEGEPEVHWTLAERMAFHGIPGLSIAVMDEGKIVWARGFGVREAGAADPVTERTLFQAASISKPIAAFAVMQLVKEGKLDLDADVNTYLTSWKLPDSPFTADQKVTLRRILSHSAGLTVHGFAGYPVGAALPTIPQILDGEPPSLSPAVRSERAPGINFKYSGGGTTIAQLVVSDVTGVDPPTYLQEHVLTPLGMTSSTYAQPLPEDLAPLAASAHHGKPPVALDGPPDNKWHVYPMVFAAGLWTTPTDLCQMALAVQRAAGGDPKGPLDPDTVRQMLTVTAAPVGLGFFLDDEGRLQRFMHNGGNDGFLSTFEATTYSGKAFAVMINGDAGSQILGEVARAIRAEYHWPKVGQIRITPAKLSQEQLALLAGTYQLKVNPNITVTITVQGNELALSVQGAPEPQSAILVPTSPTSFVARDGDLDIRADLDGDKPAPRIWLAHGQYQADRTK